MNRVLAIALGLLWVVTVVNPSFSFIVDEIGSTGNTRMPETNLLDNLVGLSGVGVKLQDQDMYERIPSLQQVILPPDVAPLAVPISLPSLPDVFGMSLYSGNPLSIPFKSNESKIIYILPQVELLGSFAEFKKRVNVENPNLRVYLKGLGWCRISSEPVGTGHVFDYTETQIWLERRGVPSGVISGFLAFFGAAGRAIGHAIGHAIDPRRELGDTQYYITPGQWEGYQGYNVPVSESNLRDWLEGSGSIKVYYALPEAGGFTLSGEGLNINESGYLTDMQYLRKYVVTNTSDRDTSLNINSPASCYIGVLNVLGPGLSGAEEVLIKTQRLSGIAKSVLPGAYGMRVERREDGVILVTDTKTQAGIEWPASRDNPLFADVSAFLDQVSEGKRKIEYRGKILSFDSAGILCEIYAPHLPSDEYVTVPYFLSNGQTIEISTHCRTHLTNIDVVQALEKLIFRNDLFILADLAKVRVTPSYMMTSGMPGSAMGVGYDFSASPNELTLSSESISAYLQGADTDHFSIPFLWRYMRYNIQEGKPAIEPYNVSTTDPAAIAKLGTIETRWRAFCREYQKMEIVWKLFFDSSLSFVQGEGYFETQWSLGEFSVVYGFSSAPALPAWGLLGPNMVGFVQEWSQLPSEQYPAISTAFDIIEYYNLLKEPDGLAQFSRLINPWDGDFDYLHQTADGYDARYLAKFLMLSTITGYDFGGGRDALTWLEEEVLGIKDGITGPVQHEWLVKIVQGMQKIQEDLSRKLPSEYLDTSDAFGPISRFLDKYKIVAEVHAMLPQSLDAMRQFLLWVGKFYDSHISSLPDALYASSTKGLITVEPGRVVYSQPSNYSFTMPSSNVMLTLDGGEFEGARIKGFHLLAPNPHGVEPVYNIEFDFAGNKMILSYDNGTNHIVATYDVRSWQGIEYKDIESFAVKIPSISSPQVISDKQNNIITVLHAGLRGPVASKLRVTDPAQYDNVILMLHRYIGSRYSSDIYLPLDLQSLSYVRLIEDIPLQRFLEANPGFRNSSIITVTRELNKFFFFLPVFTPEKQVTKVEVR